MTKRFKTFAMLSALASLLTACGGGGASNNSLVPAAPPIQDAAPASPPIQAADGMNPVSTMSVGSVPRHVQTAEYLTSPTEVATSPTRYAPYLTWAYVGRYSNATATRAAGIKVAVYSSPLMPHGRAYEKNVLASTYSSARAKNCGGGVITSYGGTGYLADVRTSSVRSYMKNVADYYVNALRAANRSSSHPYDAVFIDNANSVYGTSSLPCGYSQATWTAEMDAAVASTGYPTILNTLETNEAGVAGRVAGLKASNVIGGEYEECFNNRHWLSEEMSQLATVALLKSEGKAPGPGFWCYLDLTTASASSQIPWRLYAYASFLLTYDPNYSVWQTSFTTPSTFKVMPETGFVPLNPVTHPSAITQLRSSTGAYFRQYSSCYYRGALVGSCEIVVNPGSSTVSIPNASSYSRSAVLSGSGVLDGGSMSFGAARPTSLAGGRAAILIR